MNQKIKLAVILAFTFSVLFLNINGALAEEAGIIQKLINAGTAGGYAEATTYSLPRAVGGIINVFLGILGVVFLALTVYAGYLWLTAGGSEEKVKKAKSIMVNSIIGLIIVVFAYAITAFVVYRFSQVGLAQT